MDKCIPEGKKNRLQLIEFRFVWWKRSLWILSESPSIFGWIKTFSTEEENNWAWMSIHYSDKSELILDNGKPMDYKCLARSCLKSAWLPRALGPVFLNGFIPVRAALCAVFYWVDAALFFSCFPACRCTYWLWMFQYFTMGWSISQWNVSL